MKKRIQSQIGEAQKIRDDALAKSESGNFAYELSANSFSSHLDELNQIAKVDDDRPVFELVDFCLKASSLKNGSAPLRLISKAAEEIRSMIGYAALRLIQGGVDRKRVPKELYEELDLRLVGLLPGSSRLIVAGAANRDLLDDGLVKGSLERIFAVLDTGGEGSSFLQAINDLGPSSARHLRGFLKVIDGYSAEAVFSWKYAGQEIRHWDGAKDVLKNVVTALEVTEIIEQERNILHGKIELLSKRERIDLRTSEGHLIRILYPKVLLPNVAKLHLEQEVTLLCQATETENPLTNESSVFYELIEIQR